MKRSLSQVQWSGYWFILPAAILMLGLIVYPLFYGFYISLFDTNLLKRWEFVGWKYYFDAFINPDFSGKILLTLKYTLLVVTGNIVVGMILALLLNMKLRGRAIFRVILILPWLFPDVVVAVLWKWLYDPIYGLFNYFLMAIGLISDPIAWLSETSTALYAVVIATIWKGYPLVMVLMLAGQQTIPDELYEAASIDGSSKLKSFLHVTLPGLMPILLVTIILESVWWFKHFTITWLLTEGGPVKSTSVVSIEIFKIAFKEFNFGRAAAMSIIVFFICFLISYVLRRFNPDEKQ